MNLKQVEKNEEENGKIREEEKRKDKEGREGWDNERC